VKLSRKEAQTAENDERHVASYFSKRATCNFCAAVFSKLGKWCMLLWIGAERYVDIKQCKVCHLQAILEHYHILP
jgi:hypothetical protein